MYKYNDNELLYLISENDDDAKELLIKKYQPLILKYIKSSNLSGEEVSDFYQECMLALIKAINTYNEMYHFSFNSYFNLILKRKIIYLNKKRIKENTLSYQEDLEEYVMDAYSIKEENEIMIEENSNILSKFEMSVYQYKYIEGLKPTEIAILMNKKTKQIYDALNRIKQKISKNNKKI